jgi:hypothetical protein
MKCALQYPPCLLTLQSICLLKAYLLQSSSFIRKEFGGVPVVDPNQCIIREDVPVVILCSNKDNLDEPFLHKFTHKVIAHMDVLCPITHRVKLSAMSMALMLSILMIIGILTGMPMLSKTITPII